MEESPSNGRGMAIRPDDGAGQLAGLLPVVTSNLKELIEDPIVQRVLSRREVSARQDAMTYLVG